jgi:hypothetical protein
MAEDKYFYVGIKWKEEKDEKKDEERFSRIYNLAEKYGQMSEGGPGHTQGTDIEFGFPISKRKGAFDFLEEVVNSGYVVQTAIAEGDRGF